jgi:hypothetical protein
MTEYNSATGRPLEPNQKETENQNEGVSASLNAFIASHRKASGKRTTDSDRKSNQQKLKLDNAEDRDNEIGAPFDPARVASYLPKDKLNKQR